MTDAGVAMRAVQEWDDARAALRWLRAAVYAEQHAWLTAFALRELLGRDLTAVTFAGHE